MKTSIERRLIDFAKQHLQIQAVYKGTKPASTERTTYYFLTGNIKNTEEVFMKTKFLEIELFQDLKGKDISCFSIDHKPELVGYHTFLKECMWQRN